MGIDYYRRRSTIDLEHPTDRDTIEQMLDMFEILNVDMTMEMGAPYDRHTLIIDLGRPYYAKAAKGLLNRRFGAPVTPKKVIFNNPATIVYWSDGTKTVVKKQKGDAFKKETGLAMCYVKKFCGNNTSRGLNDILSLAGTRKKSKKKKGAK